MTTPTNELIHPSGMVDLAPEIYRQRLVIEGYMPENITAEQIVEYLTQLSDVCGMTTLITPVTHASPLYGWAGWIHWETSGAHFYAWEQPRKFFSVDVYTCLAFKAEDAVAFTQKFFNASRVEYREF